MPDMVEAGVKGAKNRRLGNLASSRCVSIICGSLLRYDAISECALACLEAAASLGNGSEVRLYCLESNIADSRVHVVRSVQALVAEPFFQSSDIIIHHFGIISELHNALVVAPRSAYIMVQFYGVTPPQFMPKAWEKVISDSFAQIGLFNNANEIVVNSAYLEDELRRIGIDVPMRRIELFGVNIGITSARGPRGVLHDRLNVVYCGRFVESKQILPLIDSLDLLTSDFPSIRLTLVGVANYSDDGYFEEIKTRVAASKLDVVFELNRTAEQVITTVAAADLLVLPSLHEGFGMPVAEALAALTPVVCSDAGSLPEVSGGLALLFQSSDPDALTDALHAALTARSTGDVMTDSGRRSYVRWADEAQEFSSKYRRSAFVERWRAAVAEIMARLKPGRSFTASGEPSRLLFPAEPSHDPGEAQLVGRIVMLKALGRMDADPAGAINVLHQWAFGCPPNQEAMIYWQNKCERNCDIEQIIRELGFSNEVRNSSLRLRSLAGIHTALRENDVRTKPGGIGGQESSLPPMDRVDVERILRSSRTPMEFVKGAYVLILGREYDPQGLEDHVKVAVNRDTWNDIMNSFYSSPEYRSRYGELTGR